MPLGPRIQGAKREDPFTTVQPGPSPGVGNGPAGVAPPAPVVVACTAKALAARIASGGFHFRLRKEGIAVQGPNTSFAEAWPPKAYESCPAETSLNSISIP